MTDIQCPLCAADPFTALRDSVGRLTTLLHRCDCAFGNQSLAYQQGVERIVNGSKNLFAFTEALPEIYREYTLEGYRVHDDNRSGFKAACHLETGNLLLLQGPRGTGKTRLAVGGASKLIAHTGVTGSFWSELELVERLFDSYKGLAEKPDLKSPGVLIIDDVGRAPQDPHYFRMFFAMLEYRYSHRKTTLFTSNLGVQEVAASYSARQVDTEAILSRLKTGTIVSVKGRDER